MNYKCEMLDTSGLKGFIKRDGSNTFKSELNKTFTNSEGVDAYYAIFVNLPQRGITGTVTVTANGEEYTSTKTGDFLHLGCLLKVKSGESFNMKVTSTSYTNAAYIFDIYEA